MSKRWLVAGSVYLIGLDAHIDINNMLLLSSSLRVLVLATLGLLSVQMLAVLAVRYLLVASCVKRLLDLCEIELRIRGQASISVWSAYSVCGSKWPGYSRRAIPLIFLSSL